MSPNTNQFFHWRLSEVRLLLGPNIDNWLDSNNHPGLRESQWKCRSHGYFNKTIKPVRKTDCTNILINLPYRRNEIVFYRFVLVRITQAHNEIIVIKFISAFHTEIFLSRYERLKRQNDCAISKEGIYFGAPFLPTAFSTKVTGFPSFFSYCESHRTLDQTHLSFSKEFLSENRF